MVMRTVVIDGNNIFLRSCRAAGAAPKPMSDRAGASTGGVTIFANLLSKYVADLSPGRLVVVWDSGISAYRRRLFPEYKAHRVPNVNDGPSFILAKEYLALIGAHQLWAPEVEADDVISYLARHSTSSEVVIVSGDKDFLQLLSGKVKVYVPGADDPIWGPSRFNGAYGIPPDMFALALAIAGDTVDGIPGVPRYGLKRAIKAINKARRVPEVMYGQDQVLADWREVVKRNLALVDLSVDIEGLDVGAVPLFKLTAEGDVAWDELMAFLARHQMVALRDRFQRRTYGQAKTAERPDRRPDRALFPLEQLTLKTG
jgi:5'-3' exonuclease